MGVGKNLKNILDDKNMTMKELAVKADMSIHTLYGITSRDSVNVRPDTVQKIAEALDIDPNLLTAYMTADQILENAFSPIDMKMDPRSRNKIIDANRDYLIENYDNLNMTGKGKLIDYSTDLVKSGNYKKEPEK